VKDKAMELYDSLSEDEQEAVKGNLIPVVESGLSSREINKRLSTFL
jgi:hypothetical protein